MANKRITDLTETSALTDTDFLAIDNASSTTRKVSYQNLGTAVSNSIAMTTALGNKQDTLTFDTTPTDLSTNPVTSGGVYTALTSKVDKVVGKQLSTEDYTTDEKTKLSGIAEGAEVNVQSDWEQTDTDADDYIKNKPSVTGAVWGSITGTLSDQVDLTDALSTKVDKVAGKGLSTEDYTTTEKTKLTALPDAATLNADLANKADDSVVVKSVNSITPTNGDVAINAEDIPADGIGDKSVSGNPIAIEDGMASVAKELSVTLEPIQDLHGYESPWIGTDTDKAPYLFRAVSDSSVQDKGTHELDKLVGGTVAWNQAIKNGNFADGTTGWSIESGATVTISDNLATITTSANNVGINQIIHVNTGHKYLMAFDVSADNVCTVRGVVASSSDYILEVEANTSKKTAAKIAPFARNLTICGFYIYATTASTIHISNIQLIDLTQMFGSTIADYIYSLEQATAGAGVSWFRNLFPASYYPFDSGTLMSVKTSAHVTRGFNQWDEEWEVGWLDSSSGLPTENNNSIRSKNFTPCISNSTYFCRRTSETGYFYIYWYDANFTYISRKDRLNQTVQFPTNAKYFKVGVYGGGNIYNHDICINISKTTGTPKNGDYVAYDGHSYSLDSDLELRGIPKLDSNSNLYYDGDVYEGSGNVQRRYGIVDLGTLTWGKRNTSSSYRFHAELSGIKQAGGPAVKGNVICSKYDVTTANHTWAGDSVGIAVSNDDAYVFVCDTTYSDATAFKSAMSGVYLVYELATPTTETADPYTSTQVIDPDGTEEYVDSRTVAIPVGHESNYANICPIEGRTGTEVQREGANVLPTATGNAVTEYGVTFTPQADGSVLVNGTATQTMTHEIGFGTFEWDGESDYWLSGCPSGGGYAYGYSLRCSATQVRFSSPDEGNGVRLRQASPQPLDGVPMSFEIVIRSGTVCNNLLFKPMLNAGLSAKPYQQYHEPETLSVFFGQIVYGGQVDFVTGKVRVTLANIASYNGETIGEPWWSSMDEYLSGTTPTIGAQVVYTLSTPIELTLTPSQLSLLEGTNILTADGTINLTYLGSMASNVQNEIDEFEAGLNNVIGSIAFIENSTAKTSHAVGEYIILNGIFCKVIAGISSGETLSFGTNIQATTIGAELRAIWGQLNA